MLFHYTFRNLPQREKFLVAALAVIFVLSLVKFVSMQLRFPVSTEKGVFTEGIAGRIKTLNPLFADFNETDRDLTTLIFSGLMRFDPESKNFVPDIAESWERSRNGLTYTLKLRQNVLWHDETPFSADDIIFTVRDVIQDPGFRNPIIKNTFEGVTVDSPAKDMVVFTLPKANSYFLSALTVGILPQHLLREASVAGLERSEFGKKPVGTGPYRLMRLKTGNDGDTADLALFPKYYGQTPQRERMRFFTFQDLDSLLEERNALHAIPKIPVAAQEAEALKKDPRFQLFSYTLNQFSAIFLNTENQFLKERPFRRAMALALDKNSLLLPGEERVDSLDLQAHPEDPAFELKPGEAAKNLEELGMSFGAEGFRTTKKGETVALKLLTMESADSGTIENLKNAWQTLGIRITVEKAAPDAFFDLVNARRYDLLLIRQNLGYNRDVYPFFHSSQIPGESSQTGLQNFGNFRSFRTNGLTEAIRKEQNPPDKEKLLTELTKVLKEETPVIFLSTPVYAYALDTRMAKFPVKSLDYHSDRLRITPYLSFQNL